MNINDTIKQLEEWRQQAVDAIDEYASGRTKITRDDVDVTDHYAKQNELKVSSLDKLIAAWKRLRDG